MTYSKITRLLGGLFLTITFLSPVCIILESPIAVAADSFNKESAAELDFLEQWIGDWEGTGTSDNQPVRDRMTVQWALNRRFLRFTYQALKGDTYEGEGYFWFNPKLKRYEWWEFNNGRWPVRQHTGYRTNNQLVLEENAGDRKMRLIFTVKDNDTIEMTEAFVKDDQVTPYAVITLRRKSNYSISRPNEVQLIGTDLIFS